MKGPERHERIRRILQTVSKNGGQLDSKAFYEAAKKEGFKSFGVSGAFFSRQLVESKDEKIALTERGKAYLENKTMPAMTGVRTRVKQPKEATPAGQNQPKQELFIKTKDYTTFCAGVDANKNVLLIGPTGSGKTLMARHYCQAHGQNYKRVNLNGGATVEDLVGHWLVKNGNTEWCDGILTEAMRKGNFLVIDEMNAATPEVMFVLNSVLDDDRMLVLVQKDGEVVMPHPDFKVVATANPTEAGVYAGTKEMNEALLDRFHLIVYVDYSEKVENAILEASGLVEKDRARVKLFAKKLRQAFNQGEVSTPFSTRSIANMAGLLKQGDGELILNRFKLNEKGVVRELYKTIVKADQLPKDADIVVGDANAATV